MKLTIKHLADRDIFMIKIENNRFYGPNMLKPTNLIFTRQELDQFKEALNNVPMA
jgi:hypothetical protein